MTRSTIALDAVLRVAEAHVAGFPGDAGIALHAPEHGAFADVHGERTFPSASTNRVLERLGLTATRAFLDELGLGDTRIERLMLDAAAVAVAPGSAPVAGKAGWLDGVRAEAGAVTLDGRTLVIAVMTARGPAAHLHDAWMATTCRELARAWADG